MRYLSASAALGAYYGSYVAAQFVTPPNPSNFTTVQGPLGLQIRFQEVSTGSGCICEQNPNVISYSGFVDISEDAHIFFWFFGANGVDPSDAPLTAWISGGPGYSSMSELFTEHGPCSIDQNLNVTSNPYAWNAAGTNTVYIDQPISVGFSYSKAVPSYIEQTSCDLIGLPFDICPDYLPNSGNNGNNCSNYGPNDQCGTFPSYNPATTASGTESAAPNFYLALQGIFAAFPNYTQNGFNFGSESYGGHFVPVFSRYIAEQNANLQEGAIEIPQKSLVINNGWYDPVIQYPTFYSYLVNPGNPYNVTIDETYSEQMNATLFGPGNCLDQLEKCNTPNGTDVICKLADDFCTADYQSIFDDQTGRDEYDIRYLLPDPYPPSYYIEYLNLDYVQQELAVFTNYTDESQLIVDTFEATGDDAKNLNIVPGLADLLDAGVALTLMFGDADYNCNWLGGLEVVSAVANASKTAGLATAYASAGFQNLTTSDGIVHGVVKQAGPLAFVRVYYAGHQVGFYQPLAEQTIFARTIAGKDVATGQTEVGITGRLYQSTGPAESTFYEGSATVQETVLPGNATYNHTSNEPMV